MKKKNVIIGSALAAVLVLGGTGVAVAVTEPFDNDDQLTGSALERASKAALAEVGSGTVTDSEADDNGYEIEVTLDDGRQVGVDLDDNFAVVRVDKDDDSDDNGSGTGSDSDDADNADDADDKPLTDAERASVEKAALAAVPGTVVDIDRSDDADHAYEVEVRREDGTEAEVDLDEKFAVVQIAEDGSDDDNDSDDDN